MSDCMRQNPALGSSPTKIVFVFKFCFIYVFFLEIWRKLPITYWTSHTEISDNKLQKFTSENSGLFVCPNISKFLQIILLSETHQLQNVLILQKHY